MERSVKKEQMRGKWFGERVRTDVYAKEVKCKAGVTGRKERERSERKGTSERVNEGVEGGEMRAEKGDDEWDARLVENKR